MYGYAIGDRITFNDVVAKIELTGEVVGFYSILAAPFVQVSCDSRIFSVLCRITNKVKE